MLLLGLLGFLSVTYQYQKESDVWAQLFPWCYVSVLLDSGSRYEVNYPSGITHFLEKLAFAVRLYLYLNGNTPT